MPAPQTEQLMLLISSLRREVASGFQQLGEQNKYARDVIPTQNSGLPSFRRSQPNASLGANDSAKLKSETHIVAGVLAGLFPWMYQKPPDDKGETKLAEMQNTSIQSAKKCCEAAKAAQSGAAGAGRSPSWIGRIFKSWLTGAVLWALLKDPLTKLWEDWAPQWLKDWLDKSVDWLKGVPKWLKTLGENIAENIGAILKLLALKLDGLLGGIVSALKTYVALPLISLLNAQKDEAGEPTDLWADKMKKELLNQMDPDTLTIPHTSTPMQDLIADLNLPETDWEPGQPFPNIIPLSGPGGDKPKKPGIKVSGWIEKIKELLEKLLTEKSGTKGVPVGPSGDPGTRGMPGIPGRGPRARPMGLFAGVQDRVDRFGLSPNWVTEVLEGMFPTQPIRATPSGMTAGTDPGKERWKNQQERHKVDLLTQIERNTRASASGVGNQPIIAPGQKSSDSQPGPLGGGKVASNFPTQGPPKLDSRAGLVNSPYSINSNSMVT